MIDWVTAELPCFHKPLPSGVVCAITPDGDIEWECVKKITVSGSFDSTVRIRSAGADGSGNATAIQFDGNPSKFLQGHNVFGSDDLLRLMLSSFNKVCCSLRINPPLEDYFKVMRGEYSITCVDINHAFEIGSLSDVRAFLRAAEFKSKTRHGRPTSKGGTVYYGQHSRRWAIKFYSKFDEITSCKKAHVLPPELRNKGLEQWAETKVRCELRLRSLELKDLGIYQAKQLTPERCAALFAEYLGRIEMTGNVTLSPEQAMALPRHVQSSYMLWRQGVDLRTVLPPRTFYRHRSSLLEFDIDLNIACETPEAANVVPLIRYISIEQICMVPDFAYEKGLVYDNTQPFKRAVGSDVHFELTDSQMAAACHNVVSFKSHLRS